MMETIEIVACTDHRFIMPVGVMMYSVCKNNSDSELRFHVIVDESVTEEDKSDLIDVAKGHDVRFYDVDSRVFSTMPLVPGLSHATYYRLLIPQILPDDVRKVLYLDGDIIVRHSLLSLWETDIEGSAVAAVTDADESVIEKYNRQKYPARLGHFNAGVLLINLYYWRVNNIRGDIESYMANHFESIRYCDQDILNYVLREKKITLPIKYNAQTQFFWVFNKMGYDYFKYEEEVMEARKDPVILHFSLGKPWMLGAEHPYKSTFEKYQNETKWQGQIWKFPSRPFMTKLLCHTNDAILNVLIKMGLLNVSFKRQKEKFFLDLPPID